MAALSPCSLVEFLLPRSVDLDQRDAIRRVSESEHAAMFPRMAQQHEDAAAYQRHDKPHAQSRYDGTDAVVLVGRSLARVQRARKQPRAREVEGRVRVHVDVDLVAAPPVRSENERDPVTDGRFCREGPTAP